MCGFELAQQEKLAQRKTWKSWSLLTRDHIWVIKLMLTDLVTMVFTCRAVSLASFGIFETGFYDTIPGWPETLDIPQVSASQVLDHRAFLYAS